MQKEAIRECRLDIFAMEAFNLTRSRAQKLIETGKITLNGNVSKPKTIAKIGDVAEFMEKKEEIVPKNIPLDIVFEDESLIVLNKQKGLICHPTAYNNEDTLVNALLYHTKNLSDIQGAERAGIVHRLDKNTSGLMLAAKSNKAHIKLQEDIKTKKIIRKYHAVCSGEMEKNEGIIDVPLAHYLGKTVKMKPDKNGLSAVTFYKVLERFKGAAYLEIQLQTGRTHQIRAHFGYLNHPLIGDDLYGAAGFRNGFLKNLKTHGQVLQSYYLSFTHPVTNEIMEFEIGPDEDLKKTLNLLRSLKNG